MFLNCGVPFSASPYGYVSVFNEAKLFYVVFLNLASKKIDKNLCGQLERLTCIYTCINGTNPLLIQECTNNLFVQLHVFQ